MRNATRLAIAAAVGLIWLQPAMATAADTRPVARHLLTVRDFGRAGYSVDGLAMAGARSYVTSLNVNAPTSVTRLSLVAPDGTTTAHRNIGALTTGPIVGSGAIWLVTSSETDGAVQANSGLLVRNDPATLRQTGTVFVGDHSLSVVAGLGAVWVVVGNQVLRIDPHRLVVTARHTFRSGNNIFRPATLQVAGGALWLLDDHNGDGAPTRVLRINPSTMQQLTIDTLPGQDYHFVAGGSRVWAVGDTAPVLATEFDAETGLRLLSRPVTTLPYGIRSAAADAYNNLWFLTNAGKLGRLAGNGTVFGTAISLFGSHPVVIAASTSRVAVIVSAGVNELAPRS